MEFALRVELNIYSCYSTKVMQWLMACAIGWNEKKQIEETLHLALVRTHSRMTVAVLEVWISNPYLAVKLDEIRGWMSITKWGLLAPLHHSWFCCKVFTRGNIKEKHVFIRDACKQSYMFLFQLHASLKKLIITAGFRYHLFCNNENKKKKKKTSSTFWYFLKYICTATQICQVPKN